MYAKCFHKILNEFIGPLNGDHQMAHTFCNNIGWDTIDPILLRASLVLNITYRNAKLIYSS
jgi:hypothetical protein